MILSRRSFLKVAGLSAVAVAGASMFTGCGSNVFTTPVEFVADPVDEADPTVKAVVKALNDNKTATSILGHSDLHNQQPNQDKKHFTDLLAKLAKSDEKAGKSTGYNKVVVVSTEMGQKKDSNGNDYYYVKVTIGKKPEKTEEKK